MRSAFQIVLSQQPTSSSLLKLPLSATIDRGGEDGIDGDCYLQIHHLEAIPGDAWSKKWKFYRVPIAIPENPEKFNEQEGLSC